MQRLIEFKEQRLYTVGEHVALLHALAQAEKWAHHTEALADRRYAVGRSVQHALSRQYKSMVRCLLHDHVHHLHVGLVSLSYLTQTSR